MHLFEGHYTIGFVGLAVTVAAFHLAIPQLKINQRTLNVARKWLVPPKCRGDFDVLAGEPIWRGHSVKTLLEHVTLAHYNRAELINWKMDDDTYRRFVLSPLIDSGSREELSWRRLLWENFHPRVRREQSPESAAKIVARYLREQVTISPDALHGLGVESIWKLHVADAAGFERIYVAAWRSVGIPARFDSSGHTEFWAGDQWVSAPRPLISSLTQASVLWRFSLRCLLCKASRK